MSIPSDMTFEMALGRLEKIVETMESGEPSLEQALKLFSEGNELVGYCSAIIEEAEGKLEALIEAKDGKNEVEPFEACATDKEDDAV